MYNDIYTSYERGVQALLERLDAQHPDRGHALTQQQRLSENIAKARRFGDTEANRSERAIIIDQLNSLAHDALGISFNELTQHAASQRRPPQPPAQQPPAQLAQLRQHLVTAFNDSELRDLCFDVGIEYENLSGTSKADKVRELIAYLQRRDDIATLVTKVQTLRPHIDWQGSMAEKTGPKGTTRPTPPAPPASTTPTAFLSYTRFDDEFVGGALTQVRTKLADTLRFLSGDSIEIFQDVADIGLGQNIQQRIKQSLTEAMVLIPIITPSYFTSQWCREELELFLERERHLQRNDLIISIYYQTVPALDAAMQHPSATQPASDPLIAEIAQRLAVDWRPLRGLALNDPQVRSKLERIAGRIITIMTGQTPAQPAPPRHTAPSASDRPTASAGQGNTVGGDKIGGNKISGDITIGDIAGTGIAIGHGAQSSVRTVNTGGGDYAEGNIDKREGVFVSGGTVHGSVIGTNYGNVTTNYGGSPDSRASAPTLTQAIELVQQAQTQAQSRGDEDTAEDLGGVVANLHAALKAEQAGNQARRKSKLTDARTQIERLAVQHPALGSLVQALAAIG